jgi:hypothetical protein
MSGNTSDIVTFGKKYFYKRSTKEIIVVKGRHHRQIPRTGYMTLKGVKYQFSDSDLALKIFADEVEYWTIPDLLAVESPWSAVQLALPLIEMIGKISYGRKADNKNFKAAARDLFPKGSIDPALSETEYAAIIATLWAGLRCGLAHTGFMQEEKDRGVDIQMNKKRKAPAIVFSRDPDDMVVEIGARKFVAAIIAGLRAVIENLRHDPIKRNDKFLTLWQRRWGPEKP